jgi:hypothetical protein
VRSTQVPAPGQDAGQDATQESGQAPRDELVAAVVVVTAAAVEMEMEMEAAAEMAAAVAAPRARTAPTVRRAAAGERETDRAVSSSDSRSREGPAVSGGALVDEHVVMVGLVSARP